MPNQLPPVPTTAQYVQALTVIEDQITQTQRELLAAHWSSPRRISTATKLAQAVGLKSYRAVNLLYGRLGKLLRQEMGYKLPGHTESYTISWFSQPSGSDCRFHMHPQMASALEQLGWVRK
jgi:hypothetical protein